MGAEASELDIAARHRGQDSGCLKVDLKDHLLGATHYVSPVCVTHLIPKQAGLGPGPHTQP